MTDPIMLAVMSSLLNGRQSGVVTDTSGGRRPQQGGNGRFKGGRAGNGGNTKRKQPEQKKKQPQPAQTGLGSIYDSVTKDSLSKLYGFSAGQMREGRNAIRAAYSSPDMVVSPGQLLLYFHSNNITGNSGKRADGTNNSNQTTGGAPKAQVQKVDNTNAPKPTSSGGGNGNSTNSTSSDAAKAEKAERELKKRQASAKAAGHVYVEPKSTYNQLVDRNKKDINSNIDTIAARQTLQTVMRGCFDLPSTNIEGYKLDAFVTKNEKLATRVQVNLSFHMQGLIPTGIYGIWNRNQTVIDKHTIVPQALVPDLLLSGDTINTFYKEGNLLGLSTETKRVVQSREYTHDGYVAFKSKKAPISLSSEYDVEESFNKLAERATQQLTLTQFNTSKTEPSPTSRPGGDLVEFGTLHT